MSEDLAQLSAGALLKGYREKRFSPVEVTQATLNRIERLDPALNAFVLMDGERAMAAARKSEARWQKGSPEGWLDGVTTTIKDLLYTREWPTRRGSHSAMLAIDPGYDAPTVAHLRAQNAIFLGKTTTPEYGWKGVTDSPLTGITRNPWNTEMTPGGSSGGASAAAAAAMGALHIGTDAGGSIRIPAAFTGTFGHKPSGGRVPAYPPAPYGPLAHVGPMTRTVGDAALMLAVLSLPDPRDPDVTPDGGVGMALGLEAGVKGLRIAYSRTLGGYPVDAEIAAAVESAARRYAELGAIVEEAEPDLPPHKEGFNTLWCAGAGHALRPADEAMRARMDSGLLEAADHGAKLSLFEHMDAQKLRLEMAKTMGLFHEDWDLLLTPQMPIPAFAAGHTRPQQDGHWNWPEWTPFTYPFNMTRQPAASVPCGFTVAGLPVAFQLVGPMHEDALVLRAARAYEATQPFRMPRL